MDLELARIFVKVIQMGGFSRAAAILKLPTSTVSRGVSRLESETGTKLLIRTTRNLALTASGRVFYENCVEHIQKLEDALKSLNSQESIVSGSVRITAPEDLGAHVISKVAAKLSKAHPGLCFEMHYSDEVIDLVKEGVDLAVRIGRLNPSRFKVKKLGESVLGLVAAPSYLNSKPKVKEPDDLKTHDCATFNFRQANPKWALKSPGKSSQSISIRPRFVANQMTSLVSVAKDGLGIAMVPLYLCSEYFFSGELVRVLPQWTGESYPVSLIAPAGSSVSARLKVVFDALADEIQSALKLEK